MPETRGDTPEDEYDDDEEEFEDEEEDEASLKKKKKRQKTIVEMKEETFGKFHAAIKAEKERREDPSFVPRFPRLTQFVMGTKFEAYMGVVILSNCAIIGVKASYDTPEMDADEQTSLFIILELIFTALFILDLALRVEAYGWTWFVDPGNMADALLVFLTGVLAVIVFPLLGIKSPLLRTFTVLRVFRLVRLARAVRQQPEFKEMWLLVRGLIGSISTLLWTYVIISGTLYVFAIAFTEMIGNDEVFKDNPVVQEQFGDVLRSMFTLFQIMTLDSWTSIARPMMQEQYLIGWAIFFFISVGCFVLMNLITAVIVEKAFDIANQDEKDLAKEKEKQREADMEELTELFMDLDQDQSGSLTRDEFEQATKHPMIRRKFMMLDFGADDLDELWNILDDGDGNLSVDEFSIGLRKMKGEAKSKDILLCVKAMRMTENHLNALDEKIDTVEANISRLWIEVGGVENDMQSLYVNCQRLEEAVTRAASNAGRLAIQRASADAKKEEKRVAEAQAKREAERAKRELEAQQAPPKPTAELAPARRTVPPAGPAAAHPPKPNGLPADGALEDREPDSPAPLVEPLHAMTLPGAPGSPGSNGDRLPVPKRGAKPPVPPIPTQRPGGM